MEIINHESYVSLEVAKLLKEAGFDWEVNICRYNSSPDKVSSNGTLTSNFNGYAFQHIAISAPTLEVTQRWLREVKGYILEITAVRKNPDDVYKTYIEYWYNIFEEGKCGHYDTYEEAQEAGIKKSLEMILEKGK